MSECSWCALYNGSSVSKQHYLTYLHASAVTPSLVSVSLPVVIAEDIMKWCIYTNLDSITPTRAHSMNLCGTLTSISNSVL